ncbi:MAG: AAA family ATPase [Lachnospiraceae bacterium]|nr:AAA family ATPase [Lachnospiraceae bacterium]MBR4145221.1 AAA family ATPase [Lachnospiraceae bacterium]MBR4781956.1 AAA family ATPase [Lachnospiraceae bacterium]MBR6474197.1 AAA family ATPase [Lachnospiraceae bacterium]
MKLKLNITLDPEYVLTKKYCAVLPIEEIKDRIRKLELPDTVIDNESITGLSLQTEYRNCESFREAILKILIEVTKLPPECFVKDIDENTYYIEYNDTLTVTISEIGANAPAVYESYRKIEEKVGWAEFKELCHEILLVSPEIKRNSIYKSFLFQNFLISVNDGCGLSTALDDFMKLISDLELFEFAKKQPVIEMRLSSKSEPDSMTIPEALEAIYGDDDGGKLICFDISEYLEKSKHNELKSFLAKLVAWEESYIFFFRIPFLEPDAFNNIRKVLADVLYVRAISIQPFNNDELKECAVRAVKEAGYSADDLVWDVFFSRICEEKSDGRFYGIQSVMKVVYEMLWLKAKSDTLAEENDAAGSKTAAHRKTILQNDVLELSSSFNKKMRNGFDELAELIGMEKISERIKEIVAQVKIAIENETMERPCLHMRFAGAPGTGKTTVARILGQIFRENGILRNGYFFEYSARDLCGEYIGQTAPKTSAICRDAYGSVLFIDEAYALYQGDDRNSDYGREALTTLVSEMENHRDDMVVVMAGYKDDMNKLMEGNAGLRSRMPFLLEFESYDRKQLFEIFMSFVKKHFNYDEEFANAASQYFDSLSKEYMESAEFANARFVRNLYERCWSKAAMRTSMSGSSKITLKKEDFLAASGEKEFSEKLATKSKIGF